MSATNTITIEPQDRTREGGNVVLSAKITGADNPDLRLWFALPERCSDWLTDLCDPFVVASVFLAMSSRSNLTVEGVVSRSLLRNLDEFQRVWSMWMPGLYRRADISVADLLDDSAVPEGVDDREILLTFSGGVDSCFSAFRHATGIGTRFPQRVTAGLMVHGFDIPLEQVDTFQRASQHSRAILESVGIDLLTCSTNFCELGLTWPHSFGSAAASCLTLLAGRFGGGMIAQGVPYSSYRHLAEGSNPLSDPLLGSNGFPILPDGSGYLRADKVLLMKDWPEFNRLLRVCWQGKRLDQNCCKCEKCIRNILTFRALGLGLPVCFEADVSDEQLKSLRTLKEITISVGYDPLIELAKSSGCQESWVGVLEKRISRSRRVRSSKTYEFYDYYKHRVVRMLRG